MSEEKRALHHRVRGKGKGKGKGRGGRREKGERRKRGYEGTAS